MQIQFYKNLEDNCHCTQACLAMVLKYYFPNKEYSYKDLDNIVKFKEGKWVWSFGWMKYFLEKNFSIVNIEKFNLEDFCKGGENYLKKIWPEDVLTTQKDNSDFKLEQNHACNLLNTKNDKGGLIWNNRTPTVEDISDLLKQDYIPLVSVNSCILDGCEKNHNQSHLALVVEIFDDCIVIHDPGLPARPYRKISMEKFIEAAFSEFKPDANVIGVKLLNRGD